MNTCHEYKNINIIEEKKQKAIPAREREKELKEGAIEEIPMMINNIFT
jgi:hypothetical protein